MSEVKEIIKIIRDSLKNGIPKNQIKGDLDLKYPLFKGESEQILKDFPEPELIKKYRFANNMLIFCIVFVTIIKILSIIGLAQDLNDLLIIILILIGICIPYFLISYLLQYRKSAYFITLGLIAASLANVFSGVNEIFKYGTIITILSLLQIIIVVLTIALPIFLLIKLWPKQSKK